MANFDAVFESVTLATERVKASLNLLNFYLDRSDGSLSNADISITAHAIIRELCGIDDVMEAHWKEASATEIEAEKSELSKQWACD